jgi:hypothetical protein
MLMDYAKGKERHEKQVENGCRGHHYRTRFLPLVG